MNISQANNLNSYESTNKILGKYESIWSKVPAIANVVTDFRSKLGQMRDTGAQRAVTTTGLTQTKTEKKARMVEMAHIWASTGFAYASKQKDQTLLAIFHYSLSDLLSGSDNAALDHCQAIYNQLVKLLPSLADYHLTSADLDELLSTITVFKDAIGEKGSTKGTSVASTQRLAQLFKETNDLLKNQLDKLLLRFQKTEPDFYKAYVNARKVVDLGGGKSKKILTDTPKAA